MNRDDVDVPPVTPGAYVQVQLKCRTYRNADGSPGWLDAPPAVLEVLDPADCCDGPEDADGDCGTVCPRCIAEWALDYYVELTDPPAAS